MGNEIQILNSIEKNSNSTQRDIAKNTGLSLGNVNILIKRLVKKGLVKIERLNTRNIRYILTPQGMKEQAEATYNYIRLSYRFIEEANLKIDMLFKSEQFNEVETILLFGERDEICEILEKRLLLVKKNYYCVKLECELESTYKPNNEDIDKEVTKNKCYAIVWHPSYKEKMQDKGINYIYLLDII